MKRIALTILLFALVCSCYLEALEIGGVELPESITVDSTSLVLNGAGLRKKLIIKVYAGALYLPVKSSDGNAILEADEPAAIRMHFIYDGVDQEKLIEAWNDGFTRSGTSADLQPEIDLFNSWFNEPAKKGDIYEIIYNPTLGTSLLINNNLSGTIPGLGFKRAVFGIWLSPNTSLTKLREAMLGL
ncbi:MAG: chalcone isomerase family protein [Candidatus Cloacimonetes bacterium]|nr:chalcone isomerase family protein [Candidatus Cloacimonadota bacterium]